MQVKELNLKRTLKSWSRITALFFIVAIPVVSQIRPIYDQGEPGLAQRLNQLNTTASVLMIGAHPDDEDTALLAYLARGENARTAYLSLTRGDGGQNIIGPELGEALGVIRTEELLQARRLDGAEQFFTRAYDFGFSKTLAEAKAKWDEKIILCDVVRVIRAYQPLVVISQFTGTAADGHGQHQYSGYISPLAVKAAGDATQCTESGVAWAVSKFYIRHRGTDEPTVRVNTGKYDPMLGRSYFEIAMQARSQHRTQEQGVLELKGDQFSMLDLADRLSGGGPQIFSGIDTSISSTGTVVGNSEPRFLDLTKHLNDSIQSALSAYRSSDRAAVIERLVEGYKLAFDAEQATRQPHSKALVNQKQRLFLDAIKRAAGIQVLALSDRETASPGEKLSISVKTFIAEKTKVAVREVKVLVPDGWNVAGVDPPTQPQQQGFARREKGDHESYFSITVPRDAALTRPYWLERPRTGDLFSWPGEHLGEPFAPALPRAQVTCDISGVPLTFDVPVEYRFADDIRGEVRREVNIVPKVAASLGQDLLIISTRASQNVGQVAINITNNADGPTTGKVRLNVPSGWKATPVEADFAMQSTGENRSVNFSIAIPQGASSGSYEINAEVTADGEKFSEKMLPIAYEHIQTHRIYRPASAMVKLIDVRTAAVKVGYIRGSGDRVPEALKQLSVDVQEIDEHLLSAGDLSRFDAIVVGIRAYQVRADVVANNKRLWDFANNGGTLIVQYQLPPTYAQRNLTPFPTQMGPRVVDENADVTIVQTSHPIFNFPNKITSEDFKGWVQERNLYNFVQMDPKYVGLLESHDAGEPENNGGLVVADIGKGKYIYCSYSLFRQLPAGVPGAYRLLANLISLPKAATAK